MMLPISNDRSDGLTLVEILTALTVVAILLAMIFSLRPAMSRRARRAVAQNDLHRIAAALEVYRERFGRYPPAGSLYKFSQTSMIAYLRDGVRNVRDVDGDFMSPLLRPPKERVLQEKYMDPFRRGQCYEYASDGEFYVLRCAGADGRWASTDEERKRGIDRARDNIVIKTAKK